MSTESKVVMFDKDLFDLQKVLKFKITDKAIAECFADEIHLQYFHWNVEHYAHTEH